jgi:ABC-type transporter Mla maintaining outer membrane lipid asymmetry permease subunit MlaE
MRVTEQIDALEVMGVNSQLLSVSQNYCFVSIFDWYQYVLGFLGGWMAERLWFTLCRIY